MKRPPMKKKSRPNPWIRVGSNIYEKLLIPPNLSPWIQEIINSTKI